MDGVHDMGGMHGFGSVPVNDQGRPFPEPWEGRVFATNLALTVALGANLDRFRFLIESMPPVAYLSSSYYERWLASMLSAVAEQGLLSGDQLAAIDAGHVPEVEPAGAEALPPEIVQVLVDAPTGYQRDLGGKAAFQSRDRVRARTRHSAGHTRLPRYVRGRCGEIISDNGNQHLPDTRAETGDITMQRLYTVRFMATELWGEQANPRDSVCLDLWESYLEPA